VHEVAGDARARGLEIARELAELSPVAMAEIKRSVYQGSEVHLEGGLEIEGHAFLETMMSEEAVAAMREYVALPFEKRRDMDERCSFATRTSTSSQSHRSRSRGGVVRRASRRPCDGTGAPESPTTSPGSPRARNRTWPRSTPRHGTRAKKTVPMGSRCPVITRSRCSAVMPPSGIACRKPLLW